MTTKQDGEKQFDLKPIEAQMLQVIQDTITNMMSNFLSFVALERLAYTVTPFTQFRVENGHLFIHEETPPTAAPEASVSTGSDNTPLKGKK